MRFRLPLLVGSLAFAATPFAHAQSASMSVPKQVEAGSAFSIQTTGSGKAVLYIVGFGQVLRQEVQLGESASFAAGVLHNAGHYLVTLAGESATDNGTLDVLPASRVANVSFLAKPSRLPVNLRDGISGAAYIFDAYQNLIPTPTSVTFQLSVGSGVTQTRTAMTREGRAWTQMDSAAKEGAAQFTARVGEISSTRIIQQVPGDPCGLKMSARPSGQKIELTTDPLRDCSGNAVPDGTIVTFTQVHDGSQTTVDVPLKRGIAQAELPAYNGSKISAATGVVLGNEIRWGKQP
ncbi:MAG TPA: hypothetical protein VK638_32030 [Edaphobacter sp.]|nr:hypothetical protein [Edaphobacter sp.]